MIFNFNAAPALRSVEGSLQKGEQPVLRSPPDKCVVIDFVAADEIHVLQHAQRGLWGKQERGKSAQKAP